MRERLVWGVVLAGFLSVNVYAFAAGDLPDLVRYLRELGPWGRLATMDLVVALAVGVAWTWRDARARRVSPVPYAVLTLLTGSAGLLLYLVRYGGSRGPARVETRPDGSLALRMARDVDAPAAEVWSVLADFDHVDRFHPYVASVDRLDARGCGLGARRRCNFTGLPSLTEEVTEWTEGRGYRVAASSALDALGATAGALWLEPLDERRTRVLFELTFRPRLGVVGRAFGRAWLEIAGAGMGPHVLAGLDHHLRTGGRLDARGRARQPAESAAAT